MKYEKLFSPIKIGEMEVRNRIAMMPMGVFSPGLLNYKNSAYTKRGADYYIERAKGGTGLIVTGILPIVPGVPFSMLNDPDGFVNDSRYLTDEIHKHDSKIFFQLTAMTGRSGEDPNGPAPAEIQNVWDPTKKNPGATKEYIKQTIKNFADASYLVKQAGGDGVEIHAVHEGYFLDQFVIEFFNLRDDEYGGSFENRLRLPTEIVKAIKEKCGEDFPVSVRYSVKSYIKDFNRGALPGEDFKEAGRDIEESLKVAKALEEAGYDMLNCDNGTYDSWYWAHPPMYMPVACNLEDVAKITEVVDIPVICAGRFDDPQLAEESIAAGKMDMLGLGRPLLADADIANKFYADDLDEIRPCISCHQGCLGRIFQFKDISCAVNPACGKEEEYKLTKADKEKSVVVVGGGLGGMEAARVAAIRGHKVDLYEKSGELGGVFIAAAQPEFKAHDKKLLQWYKKQMEDLLINVHLNTEVNKEDLDKMTYDELFIATGATERKLDAIEGVDESKITYAVDTLLNDDIKGDNVIVIGGGLTGCEIAYDLAKKGKKVTIVELSPTILNAFGLSAANYNMLMELIDYHKIDVIKNAKVVGYEDGKAAVIETIHNDPNIANRAKLMFAVGAEGIPKKHEIEADNFVVSIGYNSNQDLYEQVKGDNVYLIGDAVRPTNIMDAIWAAYEVAKDI